MKQTCCPYKFTENRQSLKEKKKGEKPKLLPLMVSGVVMNDQELKG